MAEATPLRSPQSSEPCSSGPFLDSSLNNDKSFDDFRFLLLYDIFFMRPAVRKFGYRKYK